MTAVQTFVTIGIVFAIGYATLYKADTKRDPDDEQEIAGVPTRFISLMCVSFGSVAILALAFGAPDTFLDTVESTRESAVITFKAVSVGAVFSVVGAATADSLFSR
jgi:uncharacterized membrane protein